MGSWGEQVLTVCVIIDATGISSGLVPCFARLVTMSRSEIVGRMVSTIIAFKFNMSCHSWVRLLAFFY